MLSVHTAKECRKSPGLRDASMQSLETKHDFQLFFAKTTLQTEKFLLGIEQKNNSLLEVLNTKSNVGENSFIFRYRMSAQLLLGTRGVFIEKVRGRDGRIIGLNLLPRRAVNKSESFFAD